VKRGEVLLLPVPGLVEVLLLTVEDRRDVLIKAVLLRGVIVDSSVMENRAWNLEWLH
jgi:hypothetical protein